MKSSQGGDVILLVPYVGRFAITKGIGLCDLFQKVLKAGTIFMSEVYLLLNGEGIIHLHHRKLRRYMETNT